VDGAPRCSRLGCDELAVAVFGFDAGECLVWLDPLAPGGRGAGLLCGVHADRMSPPRGWNLLDRRGTESRLWISRTTAPSAPTTPPTTRRRGHTPRVRPCAPSGPRLPFDTAPETPVPSAPAVPAAPAARTPWSPHDRPGPALAHVPDARTPLLARAFEAARPVDDPR
jgi:hypothetical protein